MRGQVGGAGGQLGALGFGAWLEFTVQNGAGSELPQNAPRPAPCWASPPLPQFPPDKRSLEGSGWLLGVVGGCLVPSGSPVCCTPVDTEGAASECDEEEEEGWPARPSPGEQGMCHQGPVGCLTPPLEWHQPEPSRVACSPKRVWS